MITGVWATIFVKADNSKKTVNQKTSTSKPARKKQASGKKPNQKIKHRGYAISITETKEAQQKQKETHDIGRTNTRGKTVNPSRKNSSILFMCKKKKKH